MTYDRVAIENLSCMTKKMLEEAGVKTRLTGDIWHKVYKDTVFDETMFYCSHDTFAVNLLKEPYVEVSVYRNKSERYAAFFLDTTTVYPKDVEQAKKAVESLAEQYKKCHEVYMMTKEDIDIANKSIEETSKKVEYRELVKYVNQVERQLNSQLQDLYRINELM